MLIASRSTSLSLLLFFNYSTWSKNIQNFLKSYAIIYTFIFSLSIFTFNWASNIRSEFFKESDNFIERLKMSSQANRGTLIKIIGRISFLELTMLPIVYKDYHLPNLVIFYDKYSPINQIKLTINNVIPGDVFAFDVYPNQYYRSAFMKYPLQNSKENYTSINLTLPIYFYMYFNSLVAIIISGFLIWIYYFTTMYAFNISAFLGCIGIFHFYSYFLIFFDFVSLIKNLTIGVVAIPIFILFSRIEESFTNERTEKNANMNEKENTN